MSKVNFRIKQQPVARNVHEMADALSHAVEDLRHAEREIEACGLALYHVMPPELVVGFMTSDPEGGLGPDVD